jgi:hypothetical protein
MRTRKTGLRLAADRWESKTERGQLMRSRLLRGTPRRLPPREGRGEYKCHGTQFDCPDARNLLGITRLFLKCEEAGNRLNQ